jgi:hypothetical protein
MVQARENDISAEQSISEGHAAKARNVIQLNLDTGGQGSK